MFEEKNYMWLLGEFARSKSKLKIIEIAFCKAEQVEASYFTDQEGIVVLSSNSKQTSKDILRKFLSKRINGLEQQPYVKPVAYANFSLHRKVFFCEDVMEILKKNVKHNNLKELFLFQEYNHEYNIYYTTELIYDGQELLIYISKRDMNNISFAINDTKHMNAVLNLSKYIVKIVENSLNKNIIRMKYDFVIDLQFNPIVFNVKLIKFVHPKLLALNKGLNADQLENLTLVKHEYKNSSYPRYDSVVKEPDMDILSPVNIEKSITANIFVSFMSKFLEGENKKSTRRKSSRQIFFSSQQISPAPSGCPETQSQDNENIPNNVENLGKLKFQGFDKFSSPQPMMNTDTENFSYSKNAIFRKDIDRKSLNSIPSGIFKRNAMFPNLQPSDSLSNFLKTEQGRILENRSKRMLEKAESTRLFPSITKRIKVKKQKNKIKKIKKVKKVKKTDKIKNSKPASSIAPYLALMK